MTIHPPTTSPLLLLAEDDRDSAFLFEHLFKRVCPAWRFVCLPDGLEAVKFMEEQEKPQIIVTDLNMPRMDGYELLSWVRARREDFRVYVVVTTSLFEPEIRNKCHELGADDLLTKGSPIENLRSVLLRFVDLTEKGLGSEPEGD